MTRWPAEGTCAIEGWHPARAFAFFAGALLSCMVLSNPVCEVVSLVAAAVLFASLAGARAWRFAGGLLVMVAAVAVVSPLFNLQGATVLFRWWGGRPYTLEALALGAATGLMLAAMMLWFASYHRVMTSEKFTYLFGRMAPSLSLLLTMVLRLVPSYRRKAERIAAARAGIGKGVGKGAPLGKRLGSAASVLGLLAADSLENAVVAADSLRARGYGLEGRTSFGLFRWSARDTAGSALLAAVFAGAVGLIVPWGFGPAYVPLIELSAPSAAAVAGLGFYGAFLLMPTAANTGRRLAWRWSLSKI